MKKARKKGTLSIGIIAAAFVSALVIFGILVYTEKKMTAKEETVRVAVAATGINKGRGLLIDEGKEIEWRDIPKSLVPEGAVTNEGELAEMVASEYVCSGSVITSGMMEKRFAPKEKMKEPVLIGFKAEDYFQTAGGRIRPGDRIYIYLRNEEGDIGLRWSDVYVADAFDAAGEPVMTWDEGKTLRYNIYLEKNDVEEFYRNLDAKMIRIALASDL